VIRCIMTLRTGEWPQRLHDVEELDKGHAGQSRAKKTSRIVEG
jgi:hypothetical protein